MTGSDPYSKSLPCSCVTDAALPGRIHIWVFLDLPRCPTLKSHLRLGSSPRSGGPWTALLSLLSCGHRPWHGRAARWAGQEVAGCDRPDNRAEVSKVGGTAKKGPGWSWEDCSTPAPPPPFVGSQPPWVSSSAESCHRGCSGVWMRVRLKCPVPPCTGGMPGGCYPTTGEHLWGHLAQAALGPARNWGFSCLALHTG